MKHYQIKVNGVGYAGESEQSELATPRHTGWTGMSPQTRSVLTFSGEPISIPGTRNMKSHLERILSRMDSGALGEVRSIEISLL
jgi:hypothetical protein